MSKKEPWYDENRSDSIRLYEQAVTDVKAAVTGGTAFDEATAAAQVPEGATRDAIADDALKVILAEEHFAGGKSIGEMADKLGLPAGRIEKARTEMLADVEQTAIEQYRREAGQKEH